MASSKAPPRMSGSEVLGCVELVVGAFKEGADLVGRLSRKHKKRKGERNYHEVLLFQVLEQGAKQVQQSYDEGFHRFGSSFKVGDDEARERLLCVAIETNADIVTSLQVACDIEKATVDLVRLHESAITSRHDAIRSLNDLHQRLEKIRPLGSFSRFSPDSSICGGDTRRNSLLLNAPEIHPGTIPPAVSVPQIPERSGLRRMLSVGGSTPHRRAKSDDPQGLRPTSSQVSIAASGLQPAPLYFNNHPAYPRPTETGPRAVPTPMVTHVRSQSTASAEKPKKAGTNKWEDTKDHPDLPDFQFLKKQKEASKHTRAHSNVSSQPSKRDSVFSLPPRNSWDTQTTMPAPVLAPFTYPANLPPPPPPPVQRPIMASSNAATGIIPMTLVTSLPPAPYHSHHTSVSRPPITSPIPEDPLDIAETSSVTSRDYDAASVYSQPDHDEQIISPSVYSPNNNYPSPSIDYPATPITNSSDPCTPLTEASSHGARSSIRSSHSSSQESSITSPSSSGAPSMHRSDTANTSTRSRASTTLSTMERQMVRGEDGQWRDVPRASLSSNLEKAREEQAQKARAKAERLYRPLHSASISSASPMSLQMGTFGLNLSPTTSKSSHARSRTLDSSIDREMAGLTKTVSSFSQESVEEKKVEKEKKGFWHIRKASKEVVEGAKESGKERKQRLKERERRMEWSSMAFAVNGGKKRLSWLG